MFISIHLPINSKQLPWVSMHHQVFPHRNSVLGVMQHIPRCALFQSHLSRALRSTFLLQYILRLSFNDFLRSVPPLRSDLWTQQSVHVLSTAPPRGRRGEGSRGPGLSNPGLEVRWPAALRCVPGSAHLNQMAELPPHHAFKFSRVRLMASLLGSGVLKAEAHLRPAGLRPSRSGFEGPCHKGLGFKLVVGLESDLLLSQLDGL